MIQRIGIVANPAKPRALPLGLELAARVRKKGKDVVFEEPVECPQGCLSLPLSSLVRESDIIFVLGGDGTLLRVAREAAPAGVPLLGVHFGRYGFIMETDPGDARDALECVLAGTYTLSERLMLRVCLERGGEIIAERLALNDAVIARGPLSRLLRLSVSVGPKEVVRYSADGLVIATPTGSTAYSLSAGGPVVHPTVEVMLLTPIAPHTLNSRALVIPASERIDVNMAGDPAQAMLTVDGQLSDELGMGDVVRIYKADFPARLVQTRPSAFYEQLESRLGFGERFDR